MKKALIISNMLFASISTFGASAMSLSLDEQSHDGRTQLTQAIRNCEESRILELTLSQDKIINQLDRNGETPLTFAIKMAVETSLAQKELESLCDTLILLGANLDQPNKLGETPWALAKKLPTQDLYNFFITSQKPTLSDIEYISNDDFEEICSDALKINEQIRKEMNINEEMNTKEQTRANEEAFTFIGFMRNIAQWFTDKLGW